MLIFPSADFDFPIFPKFAGHGVIELKALGVHFGAGLSVAGIRRRPAVFSFSFVMKPFGEGSLRNAVSDLVFVPVIGSESKTLNLTLSDSFPLRRQCLLSGCRHAKEVIGTYVTGTAILVATVFEN